MDRRESMPMSGSPYYLQRGISELHGAQQGIRPLANSNISFQPNVGLNASGSGLMAEPTQSLPPEINIGAVPSVQPAGVAMRRKRGRPRKYGPDGSVSLALSSSPVNPQNTGSQSSKRGRGRPPGTGRKLQPIPSIGNWMPTLTGAGFTPHVITVAAGEDIAGKIMSFARQGHRTVCVMAVSGSVSSVTLGQASSGGTITYEGQFDILHMSGSFLVIDNDTSQVRPGGLSISLVNPEGRVIGGGVVGLLIAATPVQVILGSFVGGSSKAKHKIKRRSGGGANPRVDMGKEMDHRAVNTAPVPGLAPGIHHQLQHQQRSQTPPTSSSLGGGAWPSPQAVDMQNSHFDIDLMRG